MAQHARLALIAITLSAGCSLGPSPRYLVTAEPLDVGRGIEQCIALELGGVRRVWWWGPGATGCGTRSTGPDLFLIADASIERPPDSDELTISYTLPLIPAGEMPVVLVVAGSTVQAVQSGRSVGLAPTPTLEVPERPRRGG
jgi:hypothetical protein